MQQQQQLMLLLLVVVAAAVVAAALFGVFCPRPVLRSRPGPRQGADRARRRVPFPHD